MLAEVELDPSLPQRAEAQDTGHHHGPSHAAPPKGAGSPAPDHGHQVIASDEGGEIGQSGQTVAKSSVGDAPASAGSAREADAGTVVGAMQSSDVVRSEQASSAGGVKAVPAVRALAKKLKIDLTRVKPTGADGVITLKDVKDAGAAGNAAIGATPPSPQQPSVRPASAAVGRSDSQAAVPPERDSSPTGGRGSSSLPLPPAGEVGAQRATGEGGRTPLSAAGKPMRTQPPGVSASGQPEQLKGVRRNMARVMAAAHAQVVPTTLVDDADLHAWIGKQDITARLIRSIVAACKAVPSLNAWFDGEKLTRTLHPHVDIGIAVDTDDGLFVPALRNADMLDGASIRTAIKRLRTQVEDRSIPASELSGYTISLSNFGMFAGRYATPVVVPPTVAIVGAGKLCHDVVAVMGGIEVHRRMPISLTFDHRACTGGEAARFLKALLDDLAQPN
jgi:2-oxoisovalerate dehydrogenase E2 component (dihydrolipoyl transacylase)